MLAVPTKTSDGLIEKSEDKMLEDIPMHRFRWPKALKGGRRFLASATNYMTAGQTVVVGGGQIAW